MVLNDNGKAKQFSVHRLVAQAFIPNPEGKPQVNHRDGCKLNSHVSNLEWCTGAENMQHACDTGLMRSGEEHYEAKLTNEQVKFIRNNPEGLHVYELSQRFNVSLTTIYKVQHGEIYRQAEGTIRIKHRLSDVDKDKIKEWYRTKYFTQTKLAEIFSVSQVTISNIVRGK